MTDPIKERESTLWSVDFPHRPARWPFFYGWAVVLFSALGVLSSMPGQTIGFSVFTEVLMEQLSISRDQISLSYMIGTICSGLLLPLGGNFFDRFGARKTMVISCVGLGLICLYFSFIDRIYLGSAGIFRFMAPGILAWLILSVGFFFIRFLGQGMMSMASTAMLGKWFHHRRGLVLSLRGLVMSIGFSLTPLALNSLLVDFGWRASYWVLALVCGFLMAIVAWIFFRDNPEECGLTMDGGYEPVGGRPKTDDLIIYRDYNRREALSTFTFWVFALTFCINSFTVTGFAFHILSIGETLGFNDETILSFFIPIIMVSIPTNFIMGWLSDHMRLKYLLSVQALAQIVAGMGFLMLPSLPGQLILIAGMGVSGGTFAALSGVVWPRFYGRRHLGAISGFFLSALVISSAMGPFVFSRLYTQFGTYDPVYIFTACLAGLFLMGSFFADNPQQRLKPDNTGSGPEAD